MKTRMLFLVAVIFMLGNSCSENQPAVGNTDLSANEFSDKLNQTPSAQLVDVRTPEEFEKGHLQNAKNINWNGNDFEAQENNLDKSKPVFVYCLSGGRSSQAAEKMRSDGFKEVYELNGGIMQWRAANLPEVAGVATSTGMTKEQFDAMINTDTNVLVDFYADWCAPCKKMKPGLDEIASEMKNELIVVRVNVDDNQALCKELKIDSLPVLQLYKNKTLAWRNSGYISKEDVMKVLK